MRVSDEASEQMVVARSSRVVDSRPAPHCPVAAPAPRLCNRATCNGPAAALGQPAAGFEEFTEGVGETD